MWLFQANYINMDNDIEVTRKIEIEEQFFETSKEIYLYAMNKAYDMKEKNEIFSSLEFIAC